MLAALFLSVLCVLGVSILANRRIEPEATGKLPQMTKTETAADKISAVLVAIGILWMLWLGLSTVGAIRMSKSVGVVESVQNGRADVRFDGFGYDFPEFDNFTKLKVGQSVAVFREGKTTEVAYRTWMFTALGTACGAVLIFGGLFGTGRGSLRFRPNLRR
jgi:hypothetical protein